MRFHILTIFPDMFTAPFAEGVVARGKQKGILDIVVHDIRDFTHDRHRTVDDYTFGGGFGMLMKPQPLFEAVEAVRARPEANPASPVILLSPQGRPLTQKIVEGFAKLDEIVMICGRYEGVDERVREHLVTDEISIGDYVLSGGELAAMVIVDAVSRLLPGVLGSIESSQDDSHTTGLLQYPQYTRPAEFRGWKAPEILLSGNHAAIEKWRRRESLRKTLHLRPDMLDKAELSDEDRRRLEEMRGGQT
ncbi:MAG: tRNA (guanosine(37)-N1)-methyltransferase TrmD [SAR202 cluster bacterium]|nr:tRNA (guanosine(37)-N1)-methyltransferase TrmD [SAR202 cluster bacterium]